MDRPSAAGKDGLIKHVMSGVNPQGCQVHSFKAPSVESATTTSSTGLRHPVVLAHVSREEQRKWFLERIEKPET